MLGIICPIHLSHKQGGIQMLIIQLELEILIIISRIHQRRVHREGTEELKHNNKVWIQEYNICKIKTSKRLSRASFQVKVSKKRLPTKLLYQNTPLKTGGKNSGRRELPALDRYGIASDQHVKKVLRLLKLLS